MIRTSDVPALRERWEQRTLPAAPHKRLAPIRSISSGGSSADRWYRVTSWRAGTKHLSSRPSSARQRRIERKRIDAVLVAVTRHYGLSFADLLGAGRKAILVEARRVLDKVLTHMHYGIVMIARIAQRDISTIQGVRATGSQDPPDRAADIQAAVRAVLHQVYFALSMEDLQETEDGIDAQEPNVFSLRRELSADLDQLYRLNDRMRRDILAYVCDALVRDAPRRDAIAASRGLWIIAQHAWVRKIVLVHLRMHHCARYERVIATQAARLGWAWVAE